jgi:hypothetical protein
MANGTIQSEGTPLPIDPLTGINPIAQAASSAMPQDPFTMAQQATIGIRGGFPGPSMISAPQLPKPIMPQPPTKISPQGAIPQGPFGTVGERKRADRQAALNSISNIVQNVQQKLYDKKVQKVQHDLEVFQGAIDGYKQGQAVGDRGQMAHNAEIIRSMTVDDPKMAKELSKAFGVNMNPLAQGKDKGKGGDQKPNEYTDGIKAFLSDTKAYNAAYAKGDRAQLPPQAQRLMQAMPQTLQPNPMYQQYLEGLKAGAYPKSGEILTFEKGVMDVAQKIQANQFNNETKMKMAENLGQAMLDRTKMQQYGQLLRTQMMQIGAGQRAEVMAEALKYRADQVLKGSTDRTNMYREKLDAEGGADAKKLKLYMDGLAKAAAKNSKDMEDAKKQGDTARMQWLNQQADGIAYQQRIANDRAAQMVNIDPQEPPDPKKMGLSDSEYLLFKSIFTDETQPSGAKAESDDEE